MGEIVRRLVWFFIVSAAIAYSVFFVVGRMLYADAKDADTVLIRDSIEKGVHHLTGMVMVHTTCTELTVKPEAVSDSRYHLAFETWDVPTVTCEREETPRHFSAIVFAPAYGVHFTASVDGEPLSISVLPYTDH